MERSLRKAIFILVPAVVILWGLNWILISCDLNKSSIGDTFGVVNSLFSGLAFAGIIITIFLQNKELGLQREELIATRKEFNTQNQTLKFQRFESTFFNMLGLHHQIVNGIDFDDKQALNIGDRILGEKAIPKVYGRDVFKLNYTKLTGKLIANKANDIESINRIYLSNFELVQTDFGHYFRHLYRIIKFVDQYNFHTQLRDSADFKNDFDIKYQYISILRSQISDFELLWLFYNCLSGYGSEKFKPLIERYCFFKNLPVSQLINGHADFYDKTAYTRKNN